MALLAAAALTAGGVASAYWAGPGGGAGSADTGTTAGVTLAPATAGGGLSPGGTADVALTIHSSNASPVHIGSLDLDVTQGDAGFAVDEAHSACTPLSVLGLDEQTNDGAGWTVPARVGAVDGELAVTLVAAVTMGTAGADACQGASLTVYLTASP